MAKLFSYRSRPFHLGPYPVETLPRCETAAGLDALTPPRALSFRRAQDPTSIVNAMRSFQSMLDATRDGLVKRERGDIPADPQERSDHLKSFAYYCDAALAGVTRIADDDWLETPFENPDVPELARKLETKQTKTLAAGIDVIMAGLKESLRAPPADCRHHTHALVVLYDYPRDPKAGEPGADWIADAQAHRAALRAMETANVLSSYIRTLGWEARAHSLAASDIDPDRMCVKAGLGMVRQGRVETPFHGPRFGVAVISTTLTLAPDRPLAPNAAPGRAWKWGSAGNAKTARTADPFAKRNFADGPHPFETLKRVDTPTTYIDTANVARVPKRANMFARSLFGDLGTKVQDAARNGNYVRKSAAAFAFRPALGAFTLLQDGDVAQAAHPTTTTNAQKNAANIKAALYFLGVDAVGISACPDWAWYSHDAAGQAITPYHENAISMIIDQGHETMEGASGDDWIACAQSMRAYLRFSLLGGVLAEHLRNLGHCARSHTVMDDEVLHPPLLLLSGLGEVSRIGEVILNPFLGPRLKSGIVTTNMALTHDKPIDFGLQRFCQSCNKCARECPSGAITAGPKLMFNGYEIWKSDSQKCTSYRLTTQGGAMCGRCMKTCPWNLEGLFAEAPFRWVAMHLPGTAKALAKLDDLAGNGGLNDAKKWWWDLEMVDEGPYAPSPHPVNRRPLSPELDLRYEDQTLAVYPAPLAPPPWGWPFAMDREAGIKAYRDMISATEHKARRARGVPPEHVYTADQGQAPVMQAVLSKVEAMTPTITKYEFSLPDGTALPPAMAGAHIDVVVAPEFFRQYSLSGDPADTARYQIAVLREDQGRGGSKLMHRIFEEGRRVFISPPINHFALHEDAIFTYLMGGGIGVTPMIAMAHRLHALGRDFALHYSCSDRASAGFLPDLQKAPWADKVILHFSSEDTRADLGALLNWRKGAHVYTCGPDTYMSAVMEAAQKNGFPEENQHLEYFSPPEQPAYENHDFTFVLARSGKRVAVRADQSPSDALLDAGVRVDVKCADGLCGVCKCRVLDGEVEHRDFVLSNAERQEWLITCQSRAAKPDGEVTLDL